MTHKGLMGAAKPASMALNTRGDLSRNRAEGGTGSRPLSPRGRGREAMTYGCAALLTEGHDLTGAAVSHSAELVRGDFLDAVANLDPSPGCRFSVT
jgi:hypothetical protein